MPLAIGIGLGPAFGVSGGGGSPAFNPTSLFSSSEQGVIYDLTSSANVFQERTGASATTPSGNGGPTGSLKDLSPNNNWTTAASDAARPTWNSAGYLQSDAVDDTLAASFTINQTITRISCIRSIGGIGATVRFYDGGTTNGCVLFGLALGQLSIFAGGAVGPISIADGEDVVITERYSGATGRLAKNVEAYVTGNTGTTGSGGGLTLFSNTAGTQQSAFRLYRLIEIARDLTDTEVTNSRVWCAAAAGLTL